MSMSLNVFTGGEFVFCLYRFVLIYKSLICVSVVSTKHHMLVHHEHII